MWEKGGIFYGLHRRKILSSKHIRRSSQITLRTIPRHNLRSDNHTHQWRACYSPVIFAREKEGNHFLQFKDDDRFDEAFCFSEESPDVLAVAAIKDDEIVGMAGASADSPSFWQIGINVNKNFEGRHIATGLVSMLKADILKKEIVPYYGTSFSNLASQHVAAKAGFEVAWVELITERNDEL